MEQLKWSDSEIEKLIAFRKQGLGPSAIAKELNRTKDSVRHKIRWMKEQQVSSAPVQRPVAIKKAPVQEPAKEEKPLRKKEPKPVLHGSVEYCMNCHAAVSNWDQHLERMDRFGCKRPY